MHVLALKNCDFNLLLLYLTSIARTLHLSDVFSSKLEQRTVSAAKQLSKKAAVF